MSFYMCVAGWDVKCAMNELWVIQTSSWGDVSDSSITETEDKAGRVISCCLTSCGGLQNALGCKVSSLTSLGRFSRPTGVVYSNNARSNNGLAW